MSSAQGITPLNSHSCEITVRYDPSFTDVVELKNPLPGMPWKYGQSRSKNNPPNFTKEDSSVCVRVALRNLSRYELAQERDDPVAFSGRLMLDLDMPALSTDDREITAVKVGMLAVNQTDSWLVSAGVKFPRSLVAEMVRKQISKATLNLGFEAADGLGRKDVTHNIQGRLDFGDGSTHRLAPASLKRPGDRLVKPLALELYKLLDAHNRKANARRLRGVSPNLQAEAPTYTSPLPIPTPYGLSYAAPHGVFVVPQAEASTQISPLPIPTPYGPPYAAPHSVFVVAPPHGFLPTFQVVPSTLEQSSQEQTPERRAALSLAHLSQT